MLQQYTVLVSNLGTYLSTNSMLHKSCVIVYAIVAPLYL